MSAAWSDAEFEACRKNFDEYTHTSERLVSLAAGGARLVPTPQESDRARSIEPKAVVTELKESWHALCFCCKRQCCPKYSVTLHWDGQKVKEHIEEFDQMQRDRAPGLPFIDRDPGFWATHNMEAECPYVCAPCADILREDGVIPPDERR